MPRFRLGDDEPWYDFDGNRLLVKEARQLEELTGMGLADFSAGLQRGKVDSIVFMIWLTKRRNGEPIQWKSLDDLDLGQLQLERDDAEQARQAREDAAREAAAERGEEPAPLPDTNGSGPTPPTAPKEEPAAPEPAAVLTS